MGPATGHTSGVRGSATRPQKTFRLKMPLKPPQNATM